MAYLNFLIPGIISFLFGKHFSDNAGIFVEKYVMESLDPTKAVMFILVSLLTLFNRQEYKKP